MCRCLAYTALVLLINRVSLLDLPLDEMRAADLGAAGVMEKIWPRVGGAVVAAMVMVSPFGALNGYIFSSGRLLSALGQDVEIADERETPVRDMATVTVSFRPDAVRRVLREQKLAALARMIACDTRLEPAIVTGDAERVRTIVDNLVSNAIKYTRQGTVTVLTETSDEGLRIQVIDTGIGIAAEHRERPVSYTHLTLPTSDLV